jgi:small subunit ribosomal protein S6
MARPYEVVYIFDSALEEPQIDQHLERFHELLKSPTQPEPITSLSHWGKRTLSYPIKSRELGYYVVAQFETDPTLLDEYERIVKLEDAVLRHLIVINEGLAPLPAAAAEPEPGSDNRVAESAPAAETVATDEGEQVEQPVAEAEEENNAPTQ